MRKLVKLVISETVLIGTSGFVEWMMEDFPGWIWGIVALAAACILVMIYWHEAAQAVRRHYLHLNETVLNKDEVTLTLTKEDGTVEVYESDGTVTRRKDGDE